MLCKCHWIVLYTVHFTAFCLGGPFFPGHGVFIGYHACSLPIMSSSCKHFGSAAAIWKADWN